MSNKKQYICTIWSIYSIIWSIFIIYNKAEPYNKSVYHFYFSHNHLQIPQPTSDTPFPHNQLHLQQIAWHPEQNH